jgi:hypothetical protein
MEDHMKTLLSILISLLMATSLFAQEEKNNSILDFAFEMELGYLPLNSWVMHQTAYTGNGLDFYLNMKAEVILLNMFFVGGNTRTNASFRGDGLVIDHSEIWYGVNAGVRIGGFEIGFRHSCFHPIQTYYNFFITTPENIVNAEGAYEELYISFKGKVKLF